MDPEKQRGDGSASAQREDASSEGKEELKQVSSPEPSKVKKQPKPSIIPDWVTNNLKDVRSLKVLARCWLISWANLILILPQRSLETLGQAAFFTMLITFILPANLPVSIFVFINFTLVLGCCLGWAWACAAMAASLRARNVTLTTSQVQQVARASQPGNLEAEFQLAIFQGRFLETKSTVVFGVFIVSAAYFSGVVQAKIPKLKFFGVFLLIVTDVMCSYGPLFPEPNYTLAKVFMIPIGCSLAIALVCQFLIFPETLNTAWQYNLIKLLGVARKTLGVHRATKDRMLHEEPHVVEAEMDPTIRAMHTGMVALAGAMDGQRGFLELEITYSRLGGKDLNMLYLKNRVMLIRLLGLNSFFHLLEMDLKTGEVKNDGPVTLHETHTIFQYRQLMHRKENEQHVELEHLLNILIESTDRPLKAIDACLEATTGWLSETVEKKKSYDHQAWLEKLEGCQHELQQAMQVFLETDRLRLIEPYRNIFKNEKSHLTPESQHLFRHTARPLFICLVFCANLANLGDELLNSHGSLVDLAKKRPKNKIWMPTGIRKIAKLLRSRKPVLGDSGKISNDLKQYESHDDDEHFEEGDHVGKRDSESSAETKVDKAVMAGRPEPRDPDSLPPTKIIHRVIRGVAAVHRFMLSPDGVHGLRFAVVTFALWIPAVLPSTVFFVYLHRGIWALIMGQTGLALSSGELVFSLGGRLIGTLLGCLFGMLFWYMSCGLAAHGNPYGLAAVCAVGFLPIVFFRIFAPPILLLPALMCGVTTILCIGYSWIDSHLVVLSNSGIGDDVAWRRTLLVIIGMTAAFIVVMFPTPPSTRELVRQGFAHSTDNISRLYAILIESWIVVDDREDTPRQKKLTTILRGRFVAAQQTLTKLRMDVKLAPLDIAYKGPWPKDKYEELLKVHSRLLGAIAQMSGALQTLDLEWRRKLLHTSAMLSPRTISEISTTLTLLANALRTGTPLPHASTSLFEATVLNQRALRQIERTIEEQHDSRDDLLTLDVIKNEQFMKHIAAVMALMTFVRQMDKFQHLVRDLVGEVDLPGYHHLKQHYDKRFMDALMPSDQQV